MKNRKLDLSQITVNSFITKLEKEKNQTVQGGDAASSPTGCPMVCNPIPYTEFNCPYTENHHCH